MKETLNANKHNLFAALFLIRERFFSNTSIILGKYWGFCPSNIGQINHNYICKFGHPETYGYPIKICKLSPQIKPSFLLFRFFTNQNNKWIRIKSTWVTLKWVFIELLHAFKGLYNACLSPSNNLQRSLSKPGLSARTININSWTSSKLQTCAHSPSGLDYTIGMALVHLSDIIKTIVSFNIFEIIIGASFKHCLPAFGALIIKQHVGRTMVVLVAT